MKSIVLGCAICALTIAGWRNLHQNRPEVAVIDFTCAIIGVVWLKREEEKND